MANWIGWCAPARGSRQPRARRLRERRMAGVTGVVVAGALALTAAGALPGPMGASAQAAPGERIVFKRDSSGDVKVLPGTGPGKVARASIDLRWVSMVEQADGVQFTVRLGRVLTNSKYDQIVEIQMKPADTGETWFLDATMSGHEPSSATASYSPDLESDSPVLCAPLTVTIEPDPGTLSVIVPDECLPTSAAKIRVYSSLSKDDTEGAGFSLDQLKVRGGYYMHSA